MTGRIELNVPAPDFALENVAGRRLGLTSFRGDKIVVLYFLRGFM